MLQRAVKGLNPTEYQILTSVPGIGPVYASGILAELVMGSHLSKFLVIKGFVLRAVLHHAPGSFDHVIPQVA